MIYLHLETIIRSNHKIHRSYQWITQLLATSVWFFIPIEDKIQLSDYVSFSKVQKYYRSEPVDECIYKYCGALL